MSAQEYKTASPVESDAGLEVCKLVKIKLIRKFQRLEGNVDCCASAYAKVCKQFGCLWRDECLALLKDEALS